MQDQPLSVRPLLVDETAGRCHRVGLYSKFQHVIARGRPFRLPLLSISEIYLKDLLSAIIQIVLLGGSIKEKLS